MARTVIRHTKFTPTGNVARNQDNGPVDKYRKLLDRQGIAYTEYFIPLVDVELETLLPEYTRFKTGFMEHIWILNKRDWLFNKAQPDEIVSVFTF